MSEVPTQASHWGFQSFADDWPAALRRTSPVVAGFALPFILIIYLAFNAGGYGVVVRSEIGLVAWWIVVVGSLCSVLPIARPTKQGAIALALLAALLAWTALSLIWTDSTARTVLEFARIASLLGIMSLAVFVGGRDSLRRSVSGAAAAIVAVAVFAVLSRFHPGLFPDLATSSLLPSSDYRLFFPLGYWNGLAALMAIGLPLSLWMATRGRWLLTRSVAASSVPVLCLVIYYTFSRGGILTATAGLLTFLLLAPGRLSLLPTLAPAAIGSVFIVAAAVERSELADSPIGSATGEGGELTLLLLAVCFGVGLLQAGVVLSERHGLLPRLRISRRAATVSWATALMLLAVLAVAVDAPGRTGDAWSEFRDEGGAGSGQSRLDSSSGNGRYQYWQVALEDFEQDPLVGQGPGTFELSWAKNGTLPGFVRQAHSLYLQSLAEYGIVGLALLLAFFGTIIGTGAARALRGRSEERRSLAAAASAGFVAFAVSAVFDWSWEMTVLPVTALLLAAAVLGPDAQSRYGQGGRFRRYRMSTPVLAGVAAISIACLAVLASVLFGSNLMENSRSAFRAGDTTSALNKARKSADVQPYSAEPRMQEALVLGYSGRPRLALNAAREATRLEPNDWRPWLVRIPQMAASADAAGESVRSFRVFRG